MASEFWVRDYGPAIAWAVAALGWLVSNHQANKRERRKEVRADIADIEKELDVTLAVIRDALLKTTDVPHEILYLKITTSLSSIDQKLERLVSRKFGDRCRIYQSSCRDAFEKLFDMASGDDVVTVGDNLPKQHQTLLDAYHCARALAHEMHMLFLCEFEP